MNVDVDHIEHVVTCMAGFESYMSGQDNGDVAYAMTCMRLNGLDVKSVAGNEGFFTAIKEGGKKLYEMIVNLLRGIKNFFFGSSGSKRDSAVTKGKDEVKEVKKVVEITVTKLERSEPVQHGSGAPKHYSESKMQSMIEEAKKSTDQMNKLISGEQFAQTGEKWLNFTSEYTNPLWDASSRAHYVQNIPQVKITDLSFGLGELKAGLKKIHDAILKQKPSGENKMYIIGTIDAGMEIYDAMLNVRTIAKKQLATASVDLEHNNNAYKKLLDFDDETLQNRGKEMQKLSTDIVRVTDALTKLIKDLETNMMSICYGVGRIAKKLDVPFDNPFDKLVLV